MTLELKRLPGPVLREGQMHTLRIGVLRTRCNQAIDLTRHCETVGCAHDNVCFCLLPSERKRTASQMSCPVASMFSATYDIHPASSSEQHAAYVNVHEVWGRNLPMDVFLNHRYQSETHNRADWFVLTEGEKVVSSLGRQPLQFQFCGKILKGCGIGSVHTHPDYRQKGYAAALLRRVDQWSSEQGHQISLLFSDIDPTYYARLGYERWSADFSICDRDMLLKLSDGPVRLKPVHYQADDPLLPTFYRLWHRQDQLCIHRDTQYWSYSANRENAGSFFVVLDEKDDSVGYIRARIKEEGCLQLTEFATDPDHPQSQRSIYRALGVLATEWECSVVEGWFPASSMVPKKPREQAITMLRSLNQGVSLLDDSDLMQKSHFWMSDAF